MLVSHPLIDYIHALYMACAFWTNEFIYQLVNLIHITALFDWQTRSSPLPLIITNALMLCTPLQVLAETCETDRPVFEMPLLLFVALVGATVGGKVPPEFAIFIM